MSNQDTPINVEVLRRLWPSLSPAARMYASQLISGRATDELPRGLSESAASALVTVAQTGDPENINYDLLVDNDVIQSAPSPAEPAPEPPAMTSVDESPSQFRVVDETRRPTQVLAPNVMPQDNAEGPLPPNFSDRARGPRQLSGSQTPRRGSARRNTPQEGRFVPSGGIDPNDPSSYYVGPDGKLYPRPDYTPAEETAIAVGAEVDPLDPAFAPVAPEETEEEAVARFRESQAGRVMPSRPRRLRISGSQRLADTQEAQRQQVANLRQTLADGSTFSTQYDTLSDLSAQYYQSLDTWEFWNYINGMEETVRRLVKSSEDFDPVEMFDRYNMLADLTVPEFEFDKTYTWIELMAMPLRFSEEQTAFLNAKFETLGLYERYRVNRPQYVTDNQDLNFQSTYKQLIAESVGRGITAQTLMDQFAEDQVGEVERILADFDDYNIALQLDSISTTYRGKPLTAKEFRAIKDAISMFDSEITEEEIQAGLTNTLRDLQRPMPFASQTEGFAAFSREAEQELKNYFESTNDPRMKWGRARRAFAEPKSLLDVAFGGVPEVTQVPSIIEQQTADMETPDLSEGGM